MIRKKSNESVVSELMEQMLGQYGLLDGYREYRLVKAWEEVAGAMVAKRTRSVNFKDGVYYVSIESPALRSELSFLRTALLQRLRELAGPKVEIKDLVFR